MTAAIPTIIAVPMMALEIPPPGTPWGVGAWVKKVAETSGRRARPCSRGGRRGGPSRRAGRGRRAVRATLVRSSRRRSVSREDRTRSRRRSMRRREQRRRWRRSGRAATPALLFPAAGRVREPARRARAPWRLPRRRSRAWPPILARAVRARSTAPRAMTELRWTRSGLGELVDDGRSQRRTGGQEGVRDGRPLPMTMATAMASPRARPTARVTAAANARAGTRDHGARTTCQRVPPRAMAASRSAATPLRAVRLKVTMVGRVMMASTTAASRMLGPQAARRTTSADPGWRPGPGSTSRAKTGDEDQEGPQTDHDAGYGGQQLDDGRERAGQAAGQTRTGRPPSPARPARPTAWPRRS